MRGGASAAAGQPDRSLLPGLVRVRRAPGVCWRTECARAAQEPPADPRCGLAYAAATAIGRAAFEPSRRARPEATHTDKFWASRAADQTRCALLDACATLSALESSVSQLAARASLAGPVVSASLSLCASAFFAHSPLAPRRRRAYAAGTLLVLLLQIALHRSADPRRVAHAAAHTSRARARLVCFLLSLFRCQGRRGEGTQRLEARPILLDRPAAIA